MFCFHSSPVRHNLFLLYPTSSSISVLHILSVRHVIYQSLTSSSSIQLAGGFNPLLYYLIFSPLSNLFIHCSPSHPFRSLCFLSLIHSSFIHLLHPFLSFPLHPCSIILFPKLPLPPPSPPKHLYLPMYFCVCVCLCSLSYLHGRNFNRFQCYSFMLLFRFVYSHRPVSKFSCSLWPRLSLHYSVRGVRRWTSHPSYRDVVFFFLSFRISVCLLPNNSLSIPNIHPRFSLSLCVS